jgi:phosphatidylglycerol lysyltransferase
LSFVSLFAVLYGAFSLFQPLRARFADQGEARERVKQLLDTYKTPSEEFFKLWPHDKQYYFDEKNEAVIAFHVYRGVALCVSDPIGNPERFMSLMVGFQNLCFNNDWLPSMVHVSDENLTLYEHSGFSMQKLGQEAIVDIEHFENELRNSKYFRQIRNRFEKNSYTFELLSPPHHKAVLSRLQAISDEWLSKGGRAERGFVMGYYTEEYMQMCQLLVARDAAGTIQAFLNIVPADFDKQEATYDLLRQSDAALSNINDYLLINMISEMQKQGYTRINMGLCPLAGLNDEDKKNNGLLDNLMQFAYANGDRFFSFSGLYKFKAKYDPVWHNKYIGYKGGLRGFSKTMTSLTRCMSKVVKL